MKINFVTSFSKDGYNKYAKKMLLSVIENWSDDLHLYAYFHDFDNDTINDLPSSDKITYRNLNLVEDMIAYRERMKQYDGTMGGKTPYNWRMDAVKWCHKVYALTDFALFTTPDDAKGGFICWLDADTITNKPFSKSKLEEIVHEQADIVHLGRTDSDYSETSFMAFNMANPNVSPYFLADLRGCYDIGEVISYREWHDGFIFERLLKIYTAHGAKVQNLTPTAKGLAAFMQSPLSQYMTHFKGNLKEPLPNTVAPDVSAGRYKKLADLVRTYSDGKKSFHIVEVGTWNGGRAIEMALAAFEKVDSVHYTGFDLFEEATEELDKIELNSKRHNTFDSVRDRLVQFADKMKKDRNKIFTCELHKGDSKVTLTNAVKTIPYADFAYIDGGHSETTVLSDYENLKHVPVIVFDDYFSKDEDGKILGDEYLGTNRLFDKLKGEGKKITVIPSTDKVKGGGITHLVALLNAEGLPEIPKNLLMVPIIVRPRDSVPKEYILSNIEENMKIIKNWSFVKKYPFNEDKAIIVSGGPSVDYNLLKEFIKEHGPYVFCVKHSYPKLIENGIVPFGCVILDPRPVNGISTHGVVRKDLFKDIRRETNFFIASMTDPSVTKLLLEKGATVYGWHAYSEAVQQAANPQNFTVKAKIDLGEDTVFVTGGTCSAMRAIGMAHIVGFRKFHLFGFDGSIPNVTEEMKKETTENKPKYFNVEAFGQKYWTTGELLAMAQDCERLFQKEDVDMQIEVYGKNTLVQTIYDHSRYKNVPHFSQFFHSSQATAAE